MTPEEEEKLKAAAEEKKKAAAKPKKAPIILKSEVVFDVKGYEMDQDLDTLAKAIMTIQVEGLTWKDSYKILPIAFGMKKIQMGIIIEEKVSTDDLFEQIQEAHPEDIQSIDVVSFNKV